MKKISIIIIAMLAIVCCVFGMTACNSGSYVVGVQSGTTGESYMLGDADWGFTGYSNIKTNSYTQASLGVQDMLNGNVDFVVVDDAVATQLVASNANTKMIDVALTVESYGIAVNPSDATLLTSVNNFIAEIKEDGTLEALFTKYANIDDDNLTGDGIEGVESATYDADKNQLVVATATGFAPFEYMLGNKFAGIDMEIAALLAAELDMELVINDMEFDAIVTSVGKNGVDIGIAAMTINAVRKKTVNFSNSYYDDAYQVIICKADDKTFDGCTTTEQLASKLKSLTK